MAAEPQQSTKKIYEKLRINLLMKPSFPDDDDDDDGDIGGYPIPRCKSALCAKKRENFLNRINRKEINYNIFIIYDDFNKHIHMAGETNMASSLASSVNSEHRADDHTYCVLMLVHRTRLSPPVLVHNCHIAI